MNSSGENDVLQAFNGVPVQELRKPASNISISSGNRCDFAYRVIAECIVNNTRYETFNGLPIREPKEGVAAISPSPEAILNVPKRLERFGRPLCRCRCTLHYGQHFFDEAAYW